MAGYRVNDLSQDSPRFGDDLVSIRGMSDSITKNPKALSRLNTKV